MSDPVTNVEIEDVLSSIRRLVSSEDRPRPETGKAQSPAPSDTDPDRLVLTPSLRVDDTPPPDDTLDDAAPEIAFDEIAGATPQPGDDTAPDSADAPEGREARDDFDDAATHPPDGKAALKARVAELEEVVSRQSDQWDPDGATDNANSGGPVASLPWEDCMPDAGDADSPDPAPRETSAEDAAPATHQSDDNPENVIAGDDSDTDRSGAEDAREFLAANDDFLDEDALRDLVADIVREELQGALGERITRNVRKLVRREIHRALASHELQ